MRISAAGGGIRHTVPFRLIRPSRVTGPVVLAEFGHLSHVTTPTAEDFWWIQKTVKKGLLERYLQVLVICNILFYLIYYLEICLRPRFTC